MGKGDWGLLGAYSGERGGGAWFSLNPQSGPVPLLACADSRTPVTFITSKPGDRSPDTSISFACDEPVCIFEYVTPLVPPLCVDCWPPSPGPRGRSRTESLRHFAIASQPRIALRTHVSPAIVLCLRVQVPPAAKSRA